MLVLRLFEQAVGEDREPDPEIGRRRVRNQISKARRKDLEEAPFTEVLLALTLGLDPDLRALEGHGLILALIGAVEMRGVLRSERSRPRLSRA